jgi:2-methylcitrate dehydratase PrpD
VAGRFSEPVRILQQALQPAAGECRVLVDQASAAAADAALVNGTAAHALDFDDAAQKGHVSAAIVPAILAEAEVLGSPGHAMVTAYAAGYEAWAELFRREPELHHNFSWHPTGVFGPVAAAAACASLRRLDAAQATHAIAIAASQCAGLIANFGSMAKPMVAGQAARAGVIAARLAASGFTGNTEALEHPKGLLMGISPHRKADVTTPLLAAGDWQLPVGGVNTKKYPTCFATHRALDAMLWLVEEYGLKPADVKRIVATTSRRNKSTLRFESPEDALQAKFSMHFAMAAALLTGRCSLLELQDGFVRRDDVRALMRLVEVRPEDREDPKRPGEAPQDVVTIETVAGRRLTHEVQYVRGGPERPLLPGELFGKFESCLAFGRLAAAPRPLFNALMEIDSLPGTRALYALASAATPAI